MVFFMIKRNFFFPHLAHKFFMLHFSQSSQLILFSTKSKKKEEFKYHVNKCLLHSRLSSLKKKKKNTESVWVKPKEGYMTLAEFEKLNQLAAEKQEEQSKQNLKYHVENAEELAARYKREQFKKYQTVTQESSSKKKKKEESDAKSSWTTVDDLYGAQPVGKWEAVNDTQQIEQHVDLELPKTDDVYYAVASVNSDEPPVKKFKEKTVTSLETEDVPSVFKKRKFGNRNIRKANDE
jgi:WW domain-binding protein 4